MTPPDWALITKSDLQAVAEGAVWEPQHGQRFLAFVHKHFRSQFSRGAFRLLDWQQRFLLPLLNWRWADGSRVKREGLLHVGKKQGKTMMVAAVCLAELFCSEEPSPYVAACAASLENSDQIFSAVRYALERSPLKALCDIKAHKKLIEVPSINGKFRCLSADADRHHGEPFSTCVVDEIHAHKNPELIRTLRYNIAGRTKAGLVLGISTAGKPDHFYFGHYQKAKRIITGEEVDPITHVAVYEADPESDYEKDQTQWKRACPSLDAPGCMTSVQFGRELRAAKGDFGEWLNFCNLRLNLWVRGSEHAWLDVTDYARYHKDIPEAELLKYEAAIGVDLSETMDPTSVSIAFDLGGRNYYVKSWCWVAEEGVRQRSRGTQAKYEQFIDQGHMTVTEGDMIDSQKVLDHILKLCQTYDVRKIRMDPRGAYILGNLVENEGYPCERVVQSHRNYHGVMTEFSKAWSEGRIWHDGSSWLKHTLGAVRCEVNKFSEVAPRRNKSADHIDGACAALLACSSIFLAPPTSGRIEVFGTGPTT